VNDKIITIGKRNPNLPFHPPAVRAGDFIYRVGTGCQGRKRSNMCGGNIEEENRWTIESIRRICNWTVRL